jgi:hypothetical protein
MQPDIKAIDEAVRSKGFTVHHSEFSCDPMCEDLKTYECDISRNAIFDTPSNGDGERHCVSVFVEPCAHEMAKRVRIKFHNTN